MPLLLAFFLLAACSGSSEEPDAITVDEARELNEAAAMLDADSVDLNAVAVDQDSDANEVTR